MINLISKFADKIQTAFKKGSLLTGRLSTDYKFTGAKTVKVIIPQTVPLNDYTRNGANRYGEPKEMEDTVQEMTLDKDKSFALTIDKGNRQEQGGLKAAGKMLALQVKEQCIPFSDRYGFAQLARKAGVIVGNAAALTKINVTERVADGVQALDDAEIPESGRTLYTSAETYKYIRLAPEFLGVDALGGKSLAAGQVGEYQGMAVVKVPASRWPENVNFMIVHKAAATFPVTLNETKLHEDPPGISGDLLEGRMIFGLFVFESKCAGVYAEVSTASGKATICEAPAITDAGALTSGTTGATIAYTTDGSDPRYSDKTQIGSSAEVAPGMVVRAYAYKKDCFPSGVTKKEIPKS